MLETKHLRQFIAVAEELNFRRAADRLGIAQPPLSLAIAKLESELGHLLLERSTRRVTLTPAGRALLAEARRIVYDLEATQRLVQRVGQGEFAVLRVATVPWMGLGSLPRALREFSKAWPGVTIRVAEQRSVQQVEALRRGSLDLGIFNRNGISLDGLAWEPLERTMPVAAVARTSPLARSASMEISQLKGVPLVTFPQHWMPVPNADFEAACRLAGFEPWVQHTVDHPYAMFNLIAHGLGVGIAQNSAQHLHPHGVKLIPIERLPSSMYGEAVLGWSRTRPLDPALRSLKEAILAQAHAAA